MEYTINGVTQKSSIEQHTISKKDDAIRKQNITKQIINIICDNQLSINEAGDVFMSAMGHLKNLKIFS